MGSFQSPKPFYTSDDLTQLQWLFDSAWTMFKAQHPTRDEASDEEIKTTLRRELFALAFRNDVADEDDLRIRLLASVSPRKALRCSLRPRRPRKSGRSPL